MGKKRRVKGDSKLSDRARAVFARTKAARAAIDLSIKGVVTDDLPVMIVGAPRRPLEQPEEPEEDAVAAPVREERARKTSKARQKRSDNAKARRALEEKVDAAVDDFVANGAAVAREVVESLKPVMGIPASARGLIIR